MYLLGYPHLMPEPFTLRPQSTASMFASILWLKYEERFLHFFIPTELSAFITALLLGTVVPLSHPPCNSTIHILPHTQLHSRVPLSAFPTGISKICPTVGKVLGGHVGFTKTMQTIHITGITKNIVAQRIARVRANHQAKVQVYHHPATSTNSMTPQWLVARRHRAQHTDPLLRLTIHLQNPKTRLRPPKANVPALLQQNLKPRMRSQ